MAIRFDDFDKSIVIDGFENGIAESPHKGISNLQNVNVISVPGEASVGFATSKITFPSIGTLAVLSTGSDVVLLDTTSGSAANIETGMALYFQSFSGIGLSTGTNVYWAKITGLTGTINLYSDFQITSIVPISIGTATGIVSFFYPAKPKYFAPDGNPYMLDSYGQVWSGTELGKWRFLGNKWAGSALYTPGRGASGKQSEGHGNGLGWYVSKAVGVATKNYLFVFRNSQIDYAIVETNTTTWVYGWKPSDGSINNDGGD